MRMPAQSGSAATIQPPGRTTRFISLSAEVGCSRCISNRSQCAASNAADGKGSAYASARCTSTVGVKPAAATLAMASATNASE
jgi:hypothetical protein